MNFDSIHVVAEPHTNSLPHSPPAIYRYQFGLATCQIITDERLFVFTPYNLAFSHIQFALASAKISKLFKKTL